LSLHQPAQRRYSAAVTKTPLLSPFPTHSSFPDVTHIILYKLRATNIHTPSF
jgi:hypothetical protein